MPPDGDSHRRRPPKPKHSISCRTTAAMIRSKPHAVPASPDRPGPDPVALNLQRLTEEHDRLQIRTSKLQKQLSESGAEYEGRIRSLQEENGEVRGNLEFISLERNVLSEMVTELEEALKREKEVWTSDKESLRELASQSEITQRDIALKNQKIEVLEKRIGEVEAELSGLRRAEQDRKSLVENLISVWTETESLLPISDSPHQKAIPKPFLKNEADLIRAVQQHRIALQNVVDENRSLKSELSALVQDNMRMQSVIKERTESEKSKLIEAQLREELRDEKERVTGLMDEMDRLKESLHYAEVVSNELKRQVNEMSVTSAASAAVISGPAAASGGQQLQAQSAVNNNPVVLRQELKSVREVIAAREAMIKSLNDKYVRHRQVWEENERRANDEIKKLDEIIDRVVLTLSDCSPHVSGCPPLKRLFEDLTRDQQISVTTLSSTIV